MKKTDEDSPQEPAPGGEATANIFIPRSWIEETDDFFVRDDPDQIEYVHVNAYDTLAARVERLEKALNGTSWPLKDGTRCFCHGLEADTHTEPCIKARAALGESK